MLSDFSWDMTGYIPKHAVNPHGDGIIPYAAERIFQLEPEPPAVGNLNEYILSALQEKNLIYFSFFLHHYEPQLNKRLATSRCKPSNAHRKIPSASAFIFLCKVQDRQLCHRLFLGSQHKLSAIKSVCGHTRLTEITVTECQQPGEHPALITPACLCDFKSIFALCCRWIFMNDPGAGLPSTYHHPRTAGCVPDRHRRSGFRNLADAAVFHIRAEDGRQYRTDWLPPPPLP